MNIVGVLSGKRKCLLAIAIAFSTFGNAQLVTYPEGLNTGEKEQWHHSGCENPSVSNRYTTYGKPQCYLFYTH